MGNPKKNKKYDTDLILNRLKYLLGDSSDTDLANALNITRVNLANWRNRKTLDYEILFEFCEKYGHDLNFLIFGKKRDEYDIERAEAAKQDLMKIIDQAKEATKELTSVKEFFRQLETDNAKNNITSHYKSDMVIKDNTITYTFTEKEGDSQTNKS